MRMLITIAAGAWLSLIATWVDTTPTGAPAVVIGSQSKSLSVKPCTGKSAEECKVSKADFKRAREAFARGIKLKDVSPEAALSAFDLAIRLFRETPSIFPHAQVFSSNSHTFTSSAATN